MPESVSLGTRLLQSLSEGAGGGHEDTSGDSGADCGDGGGMLDAELWRERSSVGVSPTAGNEKPEV